MKFTVTPNKFCKKSKMKEGKVSKGNYQGSQSLKINLDKSQIQNKI